MIRREIGVKDRREGVKRRSERYQQSDRGRTSRAEGKRGNENR